MHEHTAFWIPVEVIDKLTDDADVVEGRRNELVLSCNCRWHTQRSNEWEIQINAGIEGIHACITR